jgi:alpha-glucosidase
MSGDAQHTLDVPLDFLDRGRTYVAHIYSDDPTVSTRTKVRISRRLVDSSVVLQIKLPARGGQAIRIHPATADKTKKFQNDKSLR